MSNKGGMVASVNGLLRLASGLLLLLGGGVAAEASGGGRLVGVPPAGGIAESERRHRVGEARNKAPMHRVIVTLKGIGGGPANAAVIAHAQQRIIDGLSGHRHSVEQRYSMLPQIALAVDDAGLAALKRRSDIAGLQVTGASFPSPASGEAPRGNRPSGR